eukprot:315534-Chlamydomonas_euryale.AAC.1
MMNEDPKTRLIRELRAEVAFLREQLAAVQGPGAAAALAVAPSAAALPQPPLPSSSVKPPATKGAKTGKGAAAAPQNAGDVVDSALLGGAAGGTGGGGGGANVEEMRSRLLQSTQHDIGIMVTKLVDAVQLVQSLSNVNKQLRTCVRAPCRGVRGGNGGGGGARKQAQRIE